MHPPEPELGRGRALGLLGPFPPLLGEVPPGPHRPQRVDVDEAGGVSGLIVPLHVHAAERKAWSLGGDVPGGVCMELPFGKGKDMGLRSQLLPLRNLLVGAGASGQGPSQPVGLQSHPDGHPWNSQRPC